MEKIVSITKQGQLTIPKKHFEAIEVKYKEVENYQQFAEGLTAK